MHIAGSTGLGKLMISASQDSKHYFSILPDETDNILQIFKKNVITILTNHKFIHGDDHTYVIDIYFLFSDSLKVEMLSNQSQEDNGRK